MGGSAEAAALPASSELGQVDSQVFQLLEECRNPDTQPFVLAFPKDVWEAEIRSPDASQLLQGLAEAGYLQIPSTDVWVFFFSQHARIRDQEAENASLSAAPSRDSMQPVAVSAIATSSMPACGSMLTQDATGLSSNQQPATRTQWRPYAFSCSAGACCAEHWTIKKSW